MLIIIIAIALVFLISSVWVWHCLASFEKNKKVLFIVIGYIIVFVATFVVFQISKSGIVYEKVEIESDIRNILVSIFTALNSLVLLPYVAKQLEKVNNKELAKDKFSKKMLFIIFIFVICLTLESGYMKDVQEGILKIYKLYKDVI